MSKLLGTRHASDSVALLRRCSTSWIFRESRKIVRFCRTQASSHSSHSQSVVDDRISEAIVYAVICMSYYKYTTDTIILGFHCQ